VKRIIGVLAISMVLVAALAAPAGAGHRVGGGLEYLRTLGDIKDDSTVPEFDENTFGFIASYQYSTALFRIEGDVEWMVDYGGSDKDLIQPQAYALVGGLFYGGVGIGIGYFDGEWWSEPFYALRLGVDFALAGVDLDVFAVYRFQDAEVLEGLGKSDLDSITFGALVRFAIGD
jgi:hypothetical protein